MKAQEDTQEANRRLQAALKESAKTEEEGSQASLLLAFKSKLKSGAAAEAAKSVKSGMASSSASSTRNAIRDLGELDRQVLLELVLGSGFDKSRAVADAEYTVVPKQEPKKAKTGNDKSGLSAAPLHAGAKTPAATKKRTDPQVFKAKGHLYNYMKTVVTTGLNELTSFKEHPSGCGEQGLAHFLHNHFLESESFVRAQWAALPADHRDERIKYLEQP